MFSWPVKLYLVTMWPSVKHRLKSQNLNYKITRIKVWFLQLISLQFKYLTLPYSVNIIISQNVLYHMKDHFFFLGVFTEWVTIWYLSSSQQLKSRTFILIIIEWMKKWENQLEYNDSASPPPSPFGGGGGDWTLWSLLNDFRLKKKTLGLIGALILSVRRWVEGVESQK